MAGPRAPPGARHRASPPGATARSSAVRDRIWLDLGAYNVWGIVLPYNTVAHLLGPHRVPRPRRRVPRRRHQQDAERAVPRRRPPGDRLRHGPRSWTASRASSRMDPAELRRRNYLTAADTALRARHARTATAIRLVYDSGDFRAALDAALEAVGYDGAPRASRPPARRAASSAASASPGYVEGTAIGPFEGATRHDRPRRARRGRHRRVQLRARGTRHRSRQVAADALGIPLDWVTVIGGDTAAIPFGVGTFASRSAVTAGSSIRRRRRAGAAPSWSRAAAALLEAAPADVEIADGRGRRCAARRLGAADRPRDPGRDPDLRQARRRLARTSRRRVYHHAADRDLRQRASHVAHVEVDVGTGRGQAAALRRRPRLRQGHQPR